MKFNRPLIGAAYLAGLIMILMPLLEVAMSVAPFRAGAPAWRFGALGVLSQTYMTPMLGSIVLVSAALLLGHRGMLRAMSVFALIVTVLLLVAIPLFALDALQMRASVRTEAMRAFDQSAMIASAKLFLSAVVMALLALGAWHVTRSTKQKGPHHAVRTF